MYEIKVIRERRPGYAPGAVIRTASDVYRAFKRHFEMADREQFVVILLTQRYRVMGFHVVSIGSLTETIVHPREVFKAAILANAAAMILVHNHPSGEPTPSPEDQKLTHRMSEAGTLLGIPVLDHVIIGDENFVSLKGT